MKYQIECHECGAESPLQMVAYRNRAEAIVGWVFVCESCSPNIEGLDIETRVKKYNTESAATDSQQAKIDN